MISKEEVVWLYRCIFGREPEHESVIVGHTHVHSDFASARLALLSSQEFDTFYQGLLQKKVRYIHSDAQDSKPSRPSSIALAIIVKDGEQHIKELLESCSTLVDYAVIVDSYSTDATLLLAREVLTKNEIPHRFVQEKFVDFSTARNKAIGLVPPEFGWILMMDADEYLVRHDLDKIFALTTYPTIDAWTLPRYNFVDQFKLEPPINYPDRQARLFRNCKGFRFVGRVHENLANVERWGHVPAALPEQDNASRGPHIHHAGLINLTADEGQAKSELYARLLVGNDPT